MANKNTKLVRAEAVVDISAAAATTAFTMDVPFDGYLVIDESFARWEEDAGSQTTTAGVASIEVGGNEVATITSAKDEVIGDTDTWTVDGTYATAANPVVKVSAGDAVVLKTKTQAVGGTVTGTLRAYLAFDFGA